jgi:hypothetical protein
MVRSGHNLKVHWAIYLQKHLGPMLWSQFSAIFDNFRQKNWRFYQKPMLWLIFLQNLALFRVKNANFFAEFFGENILKIITSVPGHSDAEYLYVGTKSLYHFFTHRVVAWLDVRVWGRRRPCGKFRIFYVAPRAPNVFVLLKLSLRSYLETSCASQTSFLF